MLSEGRVLPSTSRADRNIAAASKEHCTAYAVLGDGAGQRYQAESLLELCHLRVLSRRPDVADLREQVSFRFGRSDEHEHVFDILAMFRSGYRIAYTVKPEVRLESGRFLEHMQTVAWWVRRKNFAKKVRLLTNDDLDPAERHNAELLTNLRDPDPESDSAARAVVRETRGGISIRDLTERVGRGERGYRAILRLIRLGELTPLRHEPIKPATLVKWKGTSR